MTWTRHRSVSNGLEEADCAQTRTAGPGGYSPLLSTGSLGADTMKIHGRGLIWLGLFEPDADRLDAPGRIFGLHPLAIEDASGERQRPEREQPNDGTTLLSLRTLGYVSSILQAAVARLSVSENEDMRKISAWVAIAAVPTMIAGIYGMNFQYMPELESPLGYPLVAALMVTICLLMYRDFRRQHWL